MKRDSEQILTEWLVLGAQSGDSRAMNRLLKKWHPKLMRYAGRLMRDEDAAKDIVQETFITVSRSIGRLRDPAAFPRWIYQILHRRGADLVRRKARVRRNDRTPGGICARAADEDALTSNIDVGNALRRLNDDSYRMVHLHYLHGFNLKEIARITGIPVGTVKSRLHTARNQLRQLLGDERS